MYSLWVKQVFTHTFHEKYFKGQDKGAEVKGLDRGIGNFMYIRLLEWRKGKALLSFIEGACA